MLNRLRWIIAIITAIHRRIWRSSSTSKRAEQPPVTEESVERGFETQDVRASNVAVVGVVFAGTLIITAMLLGGFFVYLRSHRQQMFRETAALPAATPVTPPRPHLESDPSGDYRQLHAEQEGQIQRYQWLDRNKGTLRIPIDRAMDLLLQRGMPTPVPHTATTTSTGVREQDRTSTQTPMARTAEATATP